MVRQAWDDCTILLPCKNRDHKLYKQREKICSSLIQSPSSWCGTSWKNVTAHRDWESQVVYFQSLLSTIEDNTT